LWPPNIHIGVGASFQKGPEICGAPNPPQKESGFWGFKKGFFKGIPRTFRGVGFWPPKLWVIWGPLERLPKPFPQKGPFFQELGNFPGNISPSF